MGDLGEVRLYQVDADWLVSVDQVWLPGSYDTEQTARAAVDLVDLPGFEDFQRDINYVTRGNRQITTADLETFAEQTRG